MHYLLNLEISGQASRHLDAGEYRVSGRELITPITASCRKACLRVLLSHRSMGSIPIYPESNFAGGGEVADPQRCTQPTHRLGETTDSRSASVC